MRTRVASLLTLFALVAMASADDFGILGYSEETVIRDDAGDDCIGLSIYNHDYSLENAYCWQYNGVVPPHTGAWGEGFDAGGATVECGLYWLTQIGYANRGMDAYVWAGGVATPPSGVLCVIPDVTGLNIGFWPTCTRNDIEIGCCVAGEFTVGFWADFSAECCSWYVCADENGPGGYPWTCVAPELGYPTGWQHVGVVFSDCRSLGLGATVTDDPSPVEGRTWGVIRGLFR